MAKQDVNQASQTKRSPISCSSRRSWSTSQGRTPWGPAPCSSLAWRRSWLPRPIFCDKHILHICMNNSWNFHKNWMMFTCIFYVRKLASIWVSIPRAPCITKHPEVNWYADWVQYFKRWQYTILEIIFLLFNFSPFFTGRNEKTNYLSNTLHNFIHISFRTA